eukprot:TRINITY_DN9051_c0_g3_i1.p1 TRINITY_DN9051_c0_g3~~TRINITY_DN9051_c0_g3_i1.p1  ORF type:complete len:563 (+),score=164.07 TRINITY_DN9051_c0_g3_i1:130-1689(+)
MLRGALARDTAADSSAQSQLAHRRRLPPRDHRHSAPRLPRLPLPGPGATPRAAPTPAPVSRERAGELYRIGAELGNDKITNHHYDWTYERILGPRRQEPLRVLEIGLGCQGGKGNLGPAIWNLNGGPGSSVRLWGRYLPRARYVGLEYDADCVANLSSAPALRAAGPPGGSVQLVAGDQSSLADLRRAAALVGGRFDVVIDDGSHFSLHQQATWEHVFPELLAPGGVHIVEDLQCGFWRTYAEHARVPPELRFAAHLARRVFPRVHGGGTAELARMDCAHYICAMTRRAADAPAAADPDALPPAAGRQLAELAAARGPHSRLSAAVAGGGSGAVARWAALLDQRGLAADLRTQSCSFAAPAPPDLDLVIDAGPAGPNPACWRPLWARVRPGGVYLWSGLQRAFAERAPGAEWLATRVAAELHLGPPFIATLPSTEPLRQWPDSPRRSHDHSLVDAGHCSALWELDCVPGSCAAVRRPHYAVHDPATCDILRRNGYRPPRSRRVLRRSRARRLGLSDAAT